MVALVVLALGCTPHFQSRERDHETCKEEYVQVAVVGGPLEVEERVASVLEENGIPCRAAGSVVYGIWVKEKERARAIQILRIDSGKHGYWVRTCEEDESVIPGEDSVSPEE